MKTKVKIAMAQILVEGGEPDRNLERAIELIKSAAKKRCDIIVLPEVLDLGWTHPSSKKDAQTIPGPRSNIICKVAQENKIFVCCGLTEKEQNKVYNTAVFINSEGEIILKYHKINLLVVEQDFYTIGDHLAVLNTNFGTIGVNICADNYHDSLEIGHTLARMGAQIILSPCAWTIEHYQTETDNPYKEKWFRPYHTLANLYNLLIVGATSVGYIVGGPYEGKKMVGCSIAVNKDGIVAKGSYNEFAGELVVFNTNIPRRKEKGTDIGLMLKKKGYYK